MKQILNVITISEIDRKVLGDPRVIDGVLRQLKHQIKKNMVIYNGKSKFTITVDVEKNGNDPEN